jgi:integrase/recombinase XerD
MHKLTTSFWFRKSKANALKGTLYVYVIIDGKKEQSDESSTHISVLKCNWDSKNQTVLTSDPLHEIKNDQLALIKKTIFKIKERLEDDNDEVSAKAIVQCFLRLKQNNRQDLSCTTLYKLFLAYESKRIAVQKLKPKTLDIYEQTGAKLRDFLTIHKYPHLSVQYININKAQKFEHFLLIDNHLEVSTTAKMLTIFKKFIKFCVSENYLDKNPLEGFKVKRAKPTRPIALTFAELNAIENIQELPHRLQKAADFFLMQCYTGLSYSDLVRVIQSPVSFVGVDSISNKEWIEQDRIKTKILAQIPIIPQAKNILLKYGGWSNIPYISNGKTNEYLKEIALYCEIDKNISTHTARKTFITTLLNRAKVYFPNAQGNSIKPLVIAKMAGWNGLRELNTYAEVERETVRQELGV